MRIHAFQGLRYAATAAPDLGDLAAPPFDQVGPEAARRLHRVHPLQFTHLTRPEAGDGETAAAHAARLHTAWRDGGSLVRDPEPSLYPYEIVLAGGGRRLGICALIGLEAPGSGVIRPHEHTVPKTLAERLDLLRETQVDLEPIFLLSDDGGRLDPLLERELDGAEPLVEHRDPTGHRHRLYRTPPGRRLDALRAVLEPAGAVIADGHHRYRVAQLYAEETGARAGEPAHAKLAVVTSLESPGVTIEPIHRWLGRGLEADAATEVVRERRRLDPAIRGVELAAAVAGTTQPAIGVRTAAGAAEIWHLDPAAGPRRLTAAASRLAVVLLHMALLPRLGVPETAATDGTVRFEADAEAIEGLLAEHGGSGVWLPPMAADEFGAAVAEGDLLPPKSTRFVPKLVSGLVWSGHDGEIG